MQDSTMGVVQLYKVHVWKYKTVWHAEISYILQRTLFYASLLYEIYLAIRSMDPPISTVP